MARNTQFALVSFGSYEELVLPLKDATTLVELLAKAKQVEHVDYELSQFEPELNGRLVEKSAKRSSKIELKLVDHDAVDHFDQQKALDDHRKARDGAEIAPYRIERISDSSKMKLIDGDLNEIHQSWSYKELLDEAKRLKGIVTE